MSILLLSQIIYLQYTEYIKCVLLQSISICYCISTELSVYGVGGVGAR